MTRRVVGRPGGARSQLAPIVRYTLQSCLPPRRRAAVVLPCVGRGAVRSAVPGAERPAEPLRQRRRRGDLQPDLPITALVIGDAVLGAEVRSGTFHFTWLSPVRIWRIVVGRWLGGTFVAASPSGRPASSPRSSPAPGERWSRGDRRRRRCGRLRRAVHRRRLHHPPHRGVVAGDRVPRRASARRGAHRHRPDLADVAVALDVRRPPRRPALPSHPRGHPRRLGCGRAPGHRRRRSCLGIAIWRMGHMSIAGASD